MYKRILSIIFCVVFVLCISLPLLFTNLKDNVVSESENRYLTAKPKFYGEDGTLNKSFFVDFEGWFNDNVGFRDEIVEKNALIQVKLFKSTPNDNVIIGKRGWLFYNNTADGNPMSYYLGTDLYTEEELEVMANNLRVTKKYLEEQGTEFVLFIAPNKERVYSEYMPSSYGAPAEVYKTKQIVDYLRENTDIRVVYPYEALLSQKQSNPKMELYYPLDTHWNPLGAYIGTATLMEELRMEMPGIDTLKVDRTGVAGCDLASMLNLASQLNKDVGYSVSGYENTQGSKQNVFMVTDSFGFTMVDYLDAQFAECHAVHVDEFSKEMLETEKYDVFVYECVERYSFRLLGFCLQ